MKLSVFGECAEWKYVPWENAQNSALGENGEWHKLEPISAQTQKNVDPKSTS
jgi:hypothetical protein